MGSIRTHFRWRTHEGGYTLRAGPQVPGDFGQATHCVPDTRQFVPDDAGQVLRLVAVDANAPCRSTEPLVDEPALYRRFAALPDTDSVLAFANQHGRLWSNPEGDLLANWAQLIGMMRWAVELADLLRDRNRRALRKRYLYLADKDYWMPVEVVGVAMGSRVRGRDADILQVAATALAAQVDQMTWEGLSPQLVHRGDLTFERVLEPQSLSQALWLQFSEALLEQRTYRPCDQCGAAIEESGYTGRAQHAYCSTKCRVAAHRARVRQQKHPKPKKGK